MITVQIEGVDKLVKKLGHVTDPMGDLIKEAAEYGKKEMKIFAKPHAADKGTLAEAATYELKGKGIDMTARIGLIERGHGMASSLAGLAPTINYGRSPGKPPPIPTIERWGVRHGFIEPGQGYRLAREIRAHGTKGIYFLEKTEEALNKELPKMVNETIKRVEKDWGA
jgi:hypothetical protein